MTPEIPDAAVRAALAERASLLADSPSPMVLPDTVLVRKMLQAALPHLLPQAPDHAAVPWRQGRRKGRNLYAVTGEDWEAHPEIGCLDTAELAAEAVRAHNVVSDLLWLLGAGHEVQAGHCDDSVYVRLIGDDDEILAGFSRDPIGQALADARAWSEREGITP